MFMGHLPGIGSQVLVLNVHAINSIVLSFSFFSQLLV